MATEISREPSANPDRRARARSATLADVAMQADVSVATVSRVLNNKAGIPIAPETVRRIRDAARRLAYRPNAIARALATRRTRTVALFSEEMTDPHFAQMLGPVEQSLRRRGYRLAVCSDTEGLLLEGRVDGAILLADPALAEERFADVLIPTAYVWSARTPLAGCVSWDDAAGAALAVRRLADLGHRHIAGLFGDYPASDGPLPDKMAGFRAAVAEAGCRGHEMRGSAASDQFENGYLLTRRALRSGRDWTAIFARNDFLALGALRALREAAVAVPDDVSVIGYNDTELARFADPPLTSVLTPIAEAGALAAIHLVDAIENERGAVPGMELPMRLTERQSCARVRSEAPE